MTSRVSVNVYVELVLVRPLLNRFLKVPAFKHRVEQKSLLAELLENARLTIASLFEVAAQLGREKVE